MPKLAKVHWALRRAAVLPLAASLVVANYGLAANSPDGQTTMLAAADTPLIEKAGKSKPSSSEIKPEEAPTPATTGYKQPPSQQPAQAGDSSSKKVWIYGGLGAAAAVAIVAVAAGGGGGGSDAPASTPSNNNNGSGTGTGTSTDAGGCNEPTPVNKNPRSPVANNPSTTPVCADLSGPWSGVLDLAGDDGLSVTATIAQDGGNIQITTSSSKAYGKLFIGGVGADCNLSIYDQNTGELWSTQRGAATASRIAIYDQVDATCPGAPKYDSLILSR